MVLTLCPSQVQHVLGAGEQDLCHLQGGKEAAALCPAGHRVVRGGVSVCGPVGRGQDWFLQRNHLVGAFAHSTGTRGGEGGMGWGRA